MFGTQRSLNKDNYQLAQAQQQDTQNDLRGVDGLYQAQMQNNQQQNQARDQFNLGALGDYSQYLNTDMNNQNRLQTQGLTDYSNYMNQSQANQQQRFNTLDSQMYQQQQFKDNQQQQNTQYLEDHPMTMQYNNGNQTQTFTQSLKQGGSVRGRYAPGGALNAFPVKGPMGNALTKNKPIQEMAKPGLPASANEPGGYGYTLQNLGSGSSPFPPFPNPLNPTNGGYGTSNNVSGAGSISGQGNLSPTASGGNITFNPVINTGDGTASGGGGSSGNTAPTGANSGSPQQFDPMQYLMMKQMMAEKGEKSPSDIADTRSLTTKATSGVGSDNEDRLKEFDDLDTTPRYDSEGNLMEAAGNSTSTSSEGRNRSVSQGSEDLNGWAPKENLQQTDNGTEMTPVSSWGRNSSSSQGSNSSLSHNSEDLNSEDPNSEDLNGWAPKENLQQTDNGTEMTPVSSWRGNQAPAYENTNPGFFKKQSPTASTRPSTLDTIPEESTKSQKNPLKQSSSLQKKPGWNASTNPDSKAKFHNGIPLPGMTGKNPEIKRRGEKNLPINPEMEMVKTGGSVGRTSYLDGGMINPQPQLPRAAFQSMEQSYNTPQPQLPSFNQASAFAQNGLNQQIQGRQGPGVLDTIGHLAPLAMLAMKEGGAVPSFKEGGLVSDEPIFTRAKSLTEHSKVSDHPFKTNAKTANYGNYGGFEVSNDDDCPRLDLPFKSGFR